MPSSSPSVPHHPASSDLRPPFGTHAPIRISLNSNKIFELVTKWVSVNNADPTDQVDRVILETFEKIQIIFNQTELERYAYTAVTFLELIDSVTGTDLAFSSYAACYDMLITSRLTSASVAWTLVEESKNFLSLLAYRSYSKGEDCALTRDDIEDCISIFYEQFLSDKNSLRRIATLFTNKDGDNFVFAEEYIWYFLCARYAVKSLKINDARKYNAFVADCCSNIFLKKYANIAIYLAYFSNDNHVIDSLLVILDELFSRADEWVLSDDARGIMLGIHLKDDLRISERSELAEQRRSLLSDKITDIIQDAERVVAKYTLPFLNNSIADSDYTDSIDPNKIDADSYMRSVNALMRIYSVIGQILNSRSGTFGATFMLDCITRMVRASGRYASLNHAIATVLIFDKDSYMSEIDEIMKDSLQTNEEKFERVVGIFAFWSVYLAHAGLARYLCQDHSIRALDILRRKNENIDSVTLSGNVPFNFTIVHFISKLYNTGKIDKAYIEEISKTYGDDSSIMSLLRAVFNIYSHYMPLEIEDKQWIASKLGMSLKRIEAQRLRLIDVKKLGGSKPK